MVNNQMCFFTFSASKASAELHKLSDESAVVSKLQATEALVRQQADEKKKLVDKLAYYKSLLEAAGLLPTSPPVEKATSVENLSLANSSAADQSQSRRVSGWPMIMLVCLFFFGFLVNIFLLCFIGLCWITVCVSVP